MKSAICLYVRNEARDIAEWVAFHDLVGFDSLLVFDNGSTDGTDRILRAAARCIDLRYHCWQDCGAGAQIAAYDAATEAYGREFDWIAFLDSDEFFVPADPIPVNHFLARFDDYSGIAIPWAIYGANGHEDFPAVPVTQAFTRRAPADFFPARHVKTILRPGFATRCLNPHCFDLAGHHAGSYCTPLREPAQWLPAPDGILPGVLATPPDYRAGRINHYFTRSRAHWRAKLQRGYRGQPNLRRDEEFNEYNRNEIDDPIALRYLPALHRKMAEIVKAADI